MSALNSDRWRIETGKNWKGTEIESVFVADIDLMRVSLEDRLNHGVGFYLQINDREMEGLGRIGCWLMLHDEDSLYHEIAKKVSLLA